MQGSISGSQYTICILMSWPSLKKLKDFEQFLFFFRKCISSIREQVYKLSSHGKFLFLCGDHWIKTYLGCLENPKINTLNRIEGSDGQYLSIHVNLMDLFTTETESAFQS